MKTLGKLEALKQLKAAYLQQMFPQDGERVPRVRFAGFDREWIPQKLKDIGKATGGTAIESEFDKNGIYKVISIGSYSEKSLYTDQGLRTFKTQKTFNRILNKNDLTMILNDKTAAGNIIGRVLHIDEDDKYVYNQRTQRIEPYGNYDSIFLYQMLNADSIRLKIVQAAQGNTQIYVNWSTICEFDYCFPNKPEQIKIGNFFRTLDNLIALHS